MTSSIDWNVDNAKGLVSIGTHSLYLRTAGPARSPGTPAVVCIAGLGGTSVDWIAVLRHVSAFARCYIYDRTGLGESEVPSNFTPESVNYVNMAKELRVLLDAADIKPPYILAMHSLAGIPGREFFHLYPEDVAGMVFLDTVTEESDSMRPDKIRKIMESVFQDVDMSFLWTERKPAMTEEEWQEIEGYHMGTVSRPEEKVSQQRKTTEFEMENFTPSSDILAAKKQYDGIVLGDRPVSVVKGDAPGETRRQLELATEGGQGTEEQRKAISDFLETADEKTLLVQFKQLRLSRNSRLVEARKSWHVILWYEPDLVAREVRWCLDEFEKLKSI
jgi:pimeloyl-ACP methyl ester carboxylesterase